MLPLSFSDEEGRLIQMVLGSRLSALEVEIAHTDRREFREMLRNQAKELEAVMAKLKDSMAGPVQSTGYRRT